MSPVSFIPASLASLDAISQIPWWLRIGLISVVFYVIPAVTKSQPKQSPPKSVARPRHKTRQPQAAGSPRTSEVIVDAVPVPVAASDATASNGLVVCGYICAGVALMLIPPLFGLAGIVCGVLAIKRQQVNQGVTLLIVSFVCTVIGMCIGATS